jgi:pyridoxine 4-dehydrogenase
LKRQGGWPPARAPERSRQTVHDNLNHGSLDVLHVVNLRVGEFDRPTPGSIADVKVVVTRSLLSVGIEDPVVDRIAAR